MQLALPWLESTPYVERFAYFQPDDGNSSLLDTSDSLITTGTIYLNQDSTPAIFETYENFYNNNNNNLQSRMNLATGIDNVVVEKITIEISV